MAGANFTSVNTIQFRNALYNILKSNVPWVGRNRAEDAIVPCALQSLGIDSQMTSPAAVMAMVVATPGVHCENFALIARVLLLSRRCRRRRRGPFCELCLTIRVCWCYPNIICRNPGELICPLDTIGEFTSFRCLFFLNNFTGIIIQ